MKTILFFLLLPLMTVSSQELFTVYFDFDQHELNTGSRKKLENWMAEYKNIKIINMHAFCDSLGTHEYNDKLAERRLQSVSALLFENKIAFADNAEQKAIGERFAQSSDQSENRKVEIQYQNLESMKLSERIGQLKVGDKLRLRNLNFYNRSGRVVPKSLPVLEELFEILHENPKLKIEIQGHICCQPQGDLEDIATLRCKTVYEYLLKKGIDKKRLSYKGFGSTMPLYPIPENSEFERDENRRVEIMIVENQ